jgi:beta-1,4-mannosyltransferase
MKKERESVFYFPHPLKKTDLEKTVPDTDILIWGSIAPYKGIDVFLEHLQQKNMLDKYKIVICGKILSSDYEKKLQSYQRPNIKIINKFLDFEKLKIWIGRARIVLFTYHKNSVLSSGALMDSIACKAFVLGPHTGAFKDLAEMEIIESYQNMEEIPDTLDAMLRKGQKNRGSLDTFIRDHSWEKFSLAFQKFISL